MSPSATAATFGDLLKYLRRRARLTQRELAQAVGYTEAHICRLEKNQRLPDLTTLAALFAPALELEDDPGSMSRLLQLAAVARGETLPQTAVLQTVSVREEAIEELGALEDVPAAPPYMVLREAWLARLRSSLAADRRVAICGLAGLGKTALAAAIARERSEVEPVFWLTLTAGVTTSVEAIVRQLALFLWTQGQTQLRTLAQRRVEGGPALPLDQQAALLGAALGQQPALLCFDDLQLIHENADAMALLRHLIAVTPAAMLLISREEVPLPNVFQIRLSGLDHEQGLELIGQLGIRLKLPLADRLFAKTGGSPMLLRLAAGQLRDRGTDQIDFVEHLETQPQVAAYLLDIVLHDLSPSARWVVALVSIFRQPIDLYDETLIELVRKASGPRDLDRALTELRRRQLIDHPHQATLHPLVRDHIYATLSADALQKKRLHRLAAEWAEAARGDIVEAAYHYSRAHELAQAVEVLGDQAERLFNRGQAAAAVAIVDEILPQLRRRRNQSPDRLRRLLTAQGDLLRSTLRAAEAEESYREALSLAQDQPAARAQIARSLAQALLQRGRTAEALQLARSAVADLSAGDTILRARLAAVECRALLALSYYEEAAHVATHALALVDQFTDYMPQIADDVRARAERTLGWVAYTRQPESPECLVHYWRALEAARRAGLSVVEAATLSNIGVALVERGDLDEALQTYQQAYDVADALGDRYSATATLHNISIIYYLRGQLDTALHEIDRVCSLERQLGDMNGLLSSENARADILVALGRVDEARRVLDQVLTANQETGDAWTLGSCLCTLADVQVLQGEIDAAFTTARQVLAMSGVNENARIHAAAECSLALAYLVSGELEAAQRVIDQKPLADLGLEVGLKWLMVTGLVALARGEAAAAVTTAQTVIERARKNDYQLFAAMADRLLKAVGNPPPRTELPWLLYGAAPQTV